MGRLEDKVAVVTGGASGIGEGTVRLFVAEGAKVVIADAQDSRGQKLAEELGPSAAYLHADVSLEADVQDTIKTALSKWGRLDCMYNNAGFGGVSGPIQDTDMDAFEQTMNVLFKGVVLGIKHAAPVMKAQGYGSIISTASVAGVGGGYGPHIYSAAKAAVIHLTKSVANELGESGVRVNCICPGGIATPIFGKGMGLTPEQADYTIDLMKARLAEGQPIKRAGLPGDIAEAALWLASDASSFVSGHALVVDGALTTGRLWSERQAAAEARLAQFKLPGNQ
ncbi:MAG: 2,5-dichloro-2,5-cyclohexadiene-1,4-diol dehydrogenase [Anaerolinea sp.]|nr:2,5-dichloro-2,5-cyclohexadiene-1,4-diol dehydrogenase [Anaerolinea sp.]